MQNPNKMIAKILDKYQYQNEMFISNCAENYGAFDEKSSSTSTNSVSVIWLQYHSYVYSRQSTYFI